jgi:hypothetical protein
MPAIGLAISGLSEVSGKNEEFKNVTALPHSHLLIRFI